MAAKNELLENTPMRISMALNVMLALGIALLLVAPDATGSGLRSVATTVVAAGEVAHASEVRYTAPAVKDQRGRVKREFVYARQVRYPVPGGVERRGRVKREAAPTATSGTIAPAINDKSTSSRARARTRLPSE